MSAYQSHVAMLAAELHYLLSNGKEVPARLRDSAKAALTRRGWTLRDKYHQTSHLILALNVAEVMESSDATIK